eukprot:gene18688-22554_t
MPAMSRNQQTRADVARLTAKWGNSTLEGPVDPWALLQRTALTIDRSDRSPFNQFQHGMIVDGIRSDTLLCVLSLYGEEDSNVDCLNGVIDAGATGRGLAEVTTHWNHDEFAFLKLRPYIPEQWAWMIRYHSFEPLFVGDEMEPYLTPQEREWLQDLKVVEEYDHKTKN